MILRKDFVFCVVLVAISTTVRCEEVGEKTYDENDWVPIAPKHVQTQSAGEEKKATGRVLNIADTPANSFFPEEIKPLKANNFQQYLRETTTFQKRPVELQPQGLPLRVKQQPQHPYKFEASSGRFQNRPSKPQKELYSAQISQQTPQQAQFVQFYQPTEYHTIPEEFLQQRPVPQALAQQQYFAPNFDIPDLPPIRLNATASRFEKRPKVQVEIPTKNDERDNVQLLYVPLETLAAQQQAGLSHRPQPEHTRLHAYQQTPVVDAPQEFISYRPVTPAKQQQIHNIQSDFAKQALEAHKLQLQFQQQAQPEIEYVVPEPVTEPPTTTKKPAAKKRKAHQPPLAVYMGGSSTSDVNEVLAMLKDARSIDVQDSVGPNSPKIFVGPSNLEAPRGYTKFELPYLSSLDSNRVERKIDQYPFFVAPLSYKAPAGYSKIPLPSPHVGSVVIKEKETRKPAIQQPEPQLVQEAQTEVYETFSLQDQQQFEYQPRPSPVPSSTVRYNKPIPEQHVIKQHEIDQINSFVPHYTENVRLPESDHRFQDAPPRGDPQHRGPEEPQQQVPGKYNFESFNRPQTQPLRHSTVRFSSPQSQVTEEQFIDEILQEQQKPSTIPVRHDEYIHPSTKANQNEGHYLQEITKPPTTQDYTQSQDDTRQYSTAPTYTHTPTRSRTTAAPAPEPYQEEITKAPNRVRTRPTQSQTHSRESYDTPTRTTHLRGRPTTTTTPTVEDQYHKETVVEPRPKPRLTTEKPKYSIQEQFSIGRSTTPSSLQYTPIAPEYQEEVIQAHRPVIYKYKQSEETALEYQQPIFQVSSSVKPRVNQHHLHQEAVDAKTHEASGNFVTGPGQQVYQFQAEEYEEQPEQVRTQNANVENYNIRQAPEQNGPLPSLINNLEDQSVRQLLQPGLIPTSAKPEEVERYEVSSYSPTSSTTAIPLSHYPSTHLPYVETTTTSRRAITRGRVRGSRYSTTTSTTPIASTRRAPVTRGRRPLPSRTRYQEDTEQTTENVLARSTPDPTKKIVTARSRFRTRGRPVAETTDRGSSAYEQEITPSHIQSNHVPSVQIIEPHVTQKIHEDFINYRPVYNVPADQELVLINNKKVTKPATEPVVIHQINQLPIKNLEEENTENTSSKLRGRRPTSTTAPHVETSRKYEIENGRGDGDEFYGFFREPSFRKASAAAPMETPRPLYSSTYVSSTLKAQVRDEEVQPQVRYRPSTENVQFVGEIRPKYQTTAQYIEASQPSLSTERYYQHTEKDVVDDEKPRVRPRVRIPTRPRGTPASPVESKQKSTDDTKTVTQRIRTRGKTHYRVPQKPKRPASESSEDEDVEGGNYPPQFKNIQTTPKPSFQITVGPEDQDQEGFQSIYRPTYVAKDNSKVDAEQNQFVENYHLPNYIPSDVKRNEDVPLALPSIATAPEVNQVIQEEQEKIGYNDESVERIVNEMALEYEDNLENIDSESTTEKIEPTNIDIQVDLEKIVTTTPPETTTQKRRRGVWKLVRKPTDVLEGAESQHLASNKNLFATEEKPTKEQPTHIEYTTLPMTTIRENEETTHIPTSTTTETGFFDSLYNIFGAPQEKQTTVESEEPAAATTVGRTTGTTDAPETSEAETEQPLTPPSITTTTTATTEQPLVELTTPLTSMTYITPMSLETWNQGILKTSTSTEISHETEICYKGKCIKSKDMTVPL